MFAADKRDCASDWTRPRGAARERGGASRRGEEREAAQRRGSQCSVQAPRGKAVKRRALTSIAFESLPVSSSGNHENMNKKGAPREKKE
jgi:hypothetical protein